MIRLSVLLTAVLLVTPMRGDLSAARAEPNLERRARKALDNAEKVFKTAQEAYGSGDLQQTQAALEEVGESVILANDSLKQTGKNPSRSPKHFKNAEIRIRALLRRLDDFRQQMSLDDREVLDKIRGPIQRVHEELLAGIMGGKKKR